MKPLALLTVIFASICIDAQCQTDPALKESWEGFKSALHEKNGILIDFISAIEPANLADTALLEEIRVISDYFDLRLGQRNVDAYEIRVLLDLNAELDEHFSDAFKTMTKDNRLTEIADFPRFQSELLNAVNKLHLSVARFNEIADKLGRKDLHLELHKSTQPPKVKF